MNCTVHVYKYIDGKFVCRFCGLERFYDHKKKDWN